MHPSYIVGNKILLNTKQKAKPDLNFNRKFTRERTYSHLHGFNKK